MQVVRNCRSCGIRYTANEKVCAEDGSELVESNDDMLGTMIGNYRVVRMLGEGGMGQVYLAVNPRIGSRVAIKVLSPLASADSKLVERFFAEAHSVNRIRHEGIVNVLDLDQLPDGRPFITMEHLLGEPLSESLSRGPLALGTSAGIIIEILDALQAAHDAGVVHRDLKPDNLFLSPQGRVKVLDFGVAKLMPNYEASLAKAATQTGALIGTPGYMSPEQVLGEPVNASTDLYALGAILYQMVTGKMAFHGSSLFELMNQIVHEPPPPPAQRRPELAGPYQDFIMRALAKQPEHRFESAAAMSAELQSISALLGPQDWTPVRGLGSSSKHPMQADTIAQSRPGMGRDTPSGIAYQDTQKAPQAPDQVQGSPHAQPADQTRSFHSAQVPLSLRHSVAAQDTAVDRASKKTSRVPLVLALAFLGAGGVSALVLSGGADKSAEGSASEMLSDGGSVIAQLAPGAPPPPTGPTGDPIPSEEGEPRAAPTVGKDAKLPKPASPKAEHQNRGGRDTKTPTSTAKTSATSTPPTPAPDAGSGESPRSAGGVSMIETGNRHKEKKIHRAPDFNTKSFEASSYTAKARALAKSIYPDAYLVTFDVPGVAPSGRTNLHLANFEATYNFLSPSHSKRTLPVGIEEDRACWVYVEVNKKGVTARIVEWDECKGRRRPNPKCSLKQVWDRAKVLGAPSSGAVAEINYLWDGWTFGIDALGIYESIPDDC